MIKIEIEVPGGSSASVTVGEIGFQFPAAAYDAYSLPNGDIAVVAPTGILATTTPASAVVDGRVTHGAAVDMEFKADEDPFDASMINTYDVTRAHNEAVLIQPGSVLLKCVGIDTVPRSGPDYYTRDGIIKQWAALHVVAAPPVANMLSPAVWTGPNRPWDAFDIDGVLGDLPSYAASGSEVPWATLKTNWGRRDLGMPLSDNTGAGYEQLTPNATGTGSSNYGSYLGITGDYALMGMLSDTWSDTDKAEAFWKSATYGYETMMAISSSAVGECEHIAGHFSFMIPHILLAIKATGKTGSYVNYLKASGNAYFQYFLHDAATIAALSPHSDTSKPYISRLRACTTVTSDTEIAVANDLTYDLGAKTRFRQGIAVRERDGAEAAIVSSVQVGPDNLITDWVWTLATPMTGNTTSDMFSVKPPFAITVGMPDWNINGAEIPRTINPLPESAYRQENQPSMRWRFGRALGMIGTPLAPFNQYIPYAEAGTNGMPSPILSESSAFIAAHSTAILAIPQIVA